MNYIITDIESRRNEYTNMNNGDPAQVAAVNGRMLTVSQYNTLARRIIGRWAPAHVKASMLNSEDAIDYVAHYIMIGDWNYDQTKSNLATYRGYCGKKAIQKYLSIIVEQEGDISTDFDVLPDDDVPSPSAHLDGIEHRESVKRQLLSLMSGLTEIQRDCVIMHHIGNISMAEIGRRLGMSREGVRRSILNAMTTMKRKAKNGG